MKIGYARVSTKGQNLDLQIEALEKVGCEKIYMETISGSAKYRPELEAMIMQLRKGDQIYVWKLDRLGRSLKNIIDLVLHLSENGVIIKGITDGIDTSTANGRLFLNVMGSLAEYERELIRERTNAGLESAKLKGRIGGRPKGFSQQTIDRLTAMRRLYQDSQLTPKQICSIISISRATFYRYSQILDQYTNEEIIQMKVK